MKKIISLAIVLVSITATFTYFFNQANNNADANSQQVQDNKQYIDGAVKWVLERRGDPETGEINIAEVRKTIKEIESRPVNNRKKALGLEWKEIGPNFVGGRTRAILIDKDNSKKLFAGGVSGGLWVSNNRGESWSVVSSFNDMAYLSVSSITQAADGDIYVGTGEGFYVGSGTGSAGVPGNGVYKSEDGGETFTHLSATEAGANPAFGNAWSAVNRLSSHPTDPNTIYAATFNGLYYTTDGGTTWQLNNNISAAFADDVVISPDGNTIFAVVGGSLYRSTDLGQSFTNLSAQFSSDQVGPKTGRRFVIDVAPSDPDYVYCMTVNNSNELNNIYQSKNNGTSWSIIGPGGSDNFNPPGQQGVYDLCLTVAPDNKEEIYAGGQLTLWRWKGSEGWNMVANTWSVHADMHTIVFDPSDPNIFYVGTDGGIYRTSDRGLTWFEFTHVVKNYNTVQFYGFDVAAASGQVAGGTQDNGTRYITYKENTLSADRSIKGGDGGYVVISRISPNALFASSVTTSGGGQVAVVERSLNGGESFGGFFDTNIDADNDGIPDDNGQFVNPFIMWEGKGDTIKNDTVIRGRMRIIQEEENCFFTYDTTVTDIVDPSMFYLATNNGIWMTRNALDPIATWYKVANSGQVDAMEVTTNGDKVYYAVNNSLSSISNLKNVIYGYRYNCQVTKCDTTTSEFNGDCDFDLSQVNITKQSLTSFSRQITNIAVDPNDDDHLVVTVGVYGTHNHVYESTNGGSSFTAIDGDLPSMPVYDAVIDAKDPNKIILATEFGVWATDQTNGGSTIWTEENNNMERVPSFMIHQRLHPKHFLYKDAVSSGNTTASDTLKQFEDSMVVWVATHGRGIFAAGFNPKTDFVDPETGIEDLTEGSSTSSELLKVYPNPVKTTGTIEVSLTAIADVRIQIFDIEGRMIKSNKIKGQSKGKHKYKFNVEDLRSGSYILNVSDGFNNLGTTKIIVVK